MFNNREHAWVCLVCAVLLSTVSGPKLGVTGKPVKQLNVRGSAICGKLRLATLSDVVRHEEGALE